MIDPSKIDFSVLPWFPLEEKSAFPRKSAIYFAIDASGIVQYIGRSKNPKIRWRQHHKFEDLQKVGYIKIAYLFIDLPDILPVIEPALISWFNPPLNTVGKKSDKPIEFLLDQNQEEVFELDLCGKTPYPHPLNNENGLMLSQVQKKLESDGIKVIERCLRRHIKGLQLLKNYNGGYEKAQIALIIDWIESRDRFSCYEEFLACRYTR